MTGSPFLTETVPSNLPGRLEERLQANPDKVALRCESETVTYRQLWERSGRLAAGFKALGVQPDEPVCVLFDTSCDYVSAWLALNWLGAVEVPINTGARGEPLAHALRLTGADRLLVDSAYLSILAEVLGSAPNIRQLVVRGDFDPGLVSSNIDIRKFADISDCGESIPPVAANRPEDTALLLFTSGSTGPSKACRIPHHYVLRQPEIFCRELGVTADDVLYAPFPLFHADGAIFTVAAAIACGGTAALAPRFSVSGFWEDCRRHGATVIDYMGATIAMLFGQPPSPGDRGHKVRLAWGVPAPPFAEAFEDRFGLRLVEVYGLSDAGIPLYNDPREPRRPGSCGRAVEPFDVRIHDENGIELPDGEAGEIVIRSDEPYLMMTGYYGDEKATAHAFRGPWLRTGDIARRDSEGFFHFVGRVKDIIRRRGENISAFDLEQLFLSHPDVVEAAAYGVPSELTEEDVMVTLVLRDGASVPASTLRDWAAERLARHMVPRYVRIATDIPRTETQKPAKYRLKAAGVTIDAIDFESTEIDRKERARG